MANVDNWFELEDSDKLQDQAKAFVAITVESYLNGIYDCPDEYEAATVEEWKGYVWNTILIDQAYNGGGEYKHLYFYGKDNMMKLVDTYLANYKDVKPYVLTH